MNAVVQEHCTHTCVSDVFLHIQNYVMPHIYSGIYISLIRSNDSLNERIKHIYSSPLVPVFHLLRGGGGQLQYIGKLPSLILLPPQIIRNEHCTHVCLMSFYTYVKLRDAPIYISLIRRNDSLNERVLIRRNDSLNERVFTLHH